MREVHKIKAQEKILIVNSKTVAQDPTMDGTTIPNYIIPQPCPVTQLYSETLLSSMGRHLLSGLTPYGHMGH